MSDKNKHIEVINNTKIEKKIERDVEEIRSKLKELFTSCSIEVCGDDCFLIVGRWFGTFATITSHDNNPIHDSHGKRKDIRIDTKEKYLPIAKEFALWYCETAKQKYVPKVRIVI